MAGWGSAGSEDVRVSEAVMQSGGVLRVTRFGSTTAWLSLDPALREAMPAFLVQPGLAGTWFARRLTEGGEERALVSVWRSAEAEAASLRVPDMLLPVDGDLDGVVREVLPVAFEARRPGPATPTILRLYDGRTHPGQLDAYVEEAMAGSRLDIERPGGPLAVCTALERPDRFVTASIWADWAGLERCTGGDIRRPLASRNLTRLAGGGPTHYEIIHSG